MTWVKNRVLLVLLVADALAAASLAFVKYAPNRLASGTPISLAQALSESSASEQVWALLLIGLPTLLLLAVVFIRRSRSSELMTLAAATLMLGGLAWLAGAQAVRLSVGGPGIERTSVSGAFWVLAGLAWLTASDALGHLGLKPLWRLAASTAVMAPLAWCLGMGLLDQLSLLKEYDNRQDLFDTAFWQHVQIVGLSLLPSLLIGVPLGIASVRQGRVMNALRSPLFAALNIIQTIPSIALFGLLMAPLAVLAAALPLLAQWGIKGIGVAPAVIALTLYSLLPIVRSTAAGLSQVSPAVIEAATGTGLTTRQVFWKVELPLALPVFVAGLRVAIVQVIGMAVVAALIGAGGFGAIMFQGLLGGAVDLVLLGVIPVIAMAVAVDAVLKAWAASLVHGF